MLILFVIRKVGQKLLSSVAVHMVIMNTGQQQLSLMAILNDYI